jgi:hypothetical protein
VTSNQPVSVILDEHRMLPTSLTRAPGRSTRQSEKPDIKYKEVCNREGVVTDPAWTTATLLQERLSMRGLLNHHRVRNICCLVHIVSLAASVMGLLYDDAKAQLIP